VELVARAYRDGLRHFREEGVKTNTLLRSDYFFSSSSPYGQMLSKSWLNQTMYAGVFGIQWINPG
jgi:hypothetical protein